MVASGRLVSLLEPKGPGRDYRYYLIPVAACLIFLVLALITGFFGLRS